MTPHRRPWVLAMRWHDLLFAHWPVPVGALRPHVPAALELDGFDGAAWLGVVPFRMSGVRFRCCPGVPTGSAFPELNVRTYVRHRDRPGVWFFSLDAGSRLAVEAARRTYGLPYFRARMTCSRADDGVVSYASERTDQRAPEATLRVRYRATSAAREAATGGLEAFLTDRDCLYAVDRRGRLRRADIQHRPWSLAMAEWSVESCDMTRLLGLANPTDPPHLLFAEDLSVQAWWPVVVAGDAGVSEP